MAVVVPGCAGLHGALRCPEEPSRAIEVTARHGRQAPAGRPPPLQTTRARQVRRVVAARPAAAADLRRWAEQALHAVLQQAYLHRLSTRKVDELVKALGWTGSRSRRCHRLEAMGTSGRRGRPQEPGPAPRRRGCPSSHHRSAARPPPTARVPSHNRLQRPERQLDTSVRPRFWFDVRQRGRAEHSIGQGAQPLTALLPVSVGRGLARALLSDGYCVQRMRW